ncbi:hypothetical protein Gotur_029985 [Gossypium turneri]
MHRIGQVDDENTDHNDVHDKFIEFQQQLNKQAAALKQTNAILRDTSHKGPTQAQERDRLKLPQGPVMRSKARQMRTKLNGTVQDFISKALDVYTKEKENQD